MDDDVAPRREHVDGREYVATQPAVEEELLDLQRLGVVIERTFGEIENPTRM